METVIEKVSEACIERAAEILRGGGLVAIPTETVYGLAASALNPTAAKKVYAAKGRPSDNPLIVHVCSDEMLKEVAAALSPMAKLLAEHFWPGPMTLVLPKGKDIPMAVTGGLDTVAVRYPSNETALAIIEKCGFPLVAPSANSSGKPSPTRATHVAYDLSGKIDMIVDGGPCAIGLESTIVDVTGEEPVILRPGYISDRDIAEVLTGAVEKSSGIVPEDAVPRAPGMKYQHYAPKAEITVVMGAPEKVAPKINELVDAAEAEGKRAGVLTTEESRLFYRDGHIISIGSIKDMDEIARNLFKALRKFDFYGIDMVFAEGFPAQGIGEAVMNRLMKAAAYRVIEIE